MTRKNPDFSRWGKVLRKLAPGSLDTAGMILLSGSAMTWNLTAGLAAAGISCLALNWRWFGNE